MLLTGLQTALAHLLLETVPPPLCLPSQLAARGVQQEAVRVFEHALFSSNVHLALKMAQRFNLQLKSQGWDHNASSSLPGEVTFCRLGEQNLCNVCPAKRTRYKANGLELQVNLE